jgi:ABC-type Fe3+ transport system permease subunit
MQLNLRRYRLRLGHDRIHALGSDRWSLAVFALVLATLALLALAIGWGLADFFRTQGSSLAGVSRALARRASLAATVKALLFLAGIWLAVRYATDRTIAVLAFDRAVRAKLLRTIARILSTLPTIILGNALLVLVNGCHLKPRGAFATHLFLIGAVTLVSLPTALQVAGELLKDLDKRQLTQALALGLSRIKIGNAIVVPRLRGALNAAVTMALARTIIEAYIVLNHTLRVRSLAETINDAKGIMDTFVGLYSAMTIRDNVIVIVVLWIMALVVNLILVNLPVAASTS